jgi:hypothetical protein
MCEMKGCEGMKYNMMEGSKLVKLCPDPRNIFRLVFRIYYYVDNIMIMYFVPSYIPPKIENIRGNPYIVQRNWVLNVLSD